MKVLVACECSGIVRSAFRARGHDAWSNDLVAALDGSPHHITADVRTVLDNGWDLVVAHPPCTRLTNAGVRWLSVPPRGRTLQSMWDELQEGVDLFQACLDAPSPRVAVENPVMHGYARDMLLRLPVPQVVQPWWFGDRTFKATGWWLRGLPPLTATNRLLPPATGTPEHKAWSWVHRASPGAGRAALRSTFHPGMAAAMANQWGNPTNKEFDE